jgi:hypothetical protein
MSRAIFEIYYENEDGAREQQATVTIETRDDESRDLVVGSVLGLLYAGAEERRITGPNGPLMVGEEVAH